MEINPNFWKDKSVFITGHTGFKGSWLALWLSSLGAKIYGYSLKPPTNPNLFEILDIKKRIKKSTIADILDFTKLKKSLNKSNSSIIFHLAAQPLVRKSYDDPVKTFKTNLIGTVNLLEAAKQLNTVKTFINITTDKCYENHDTDRFYKETDRIGGKDPYSGSKACSEIATSVFRNSFFSKNQISIATARAGNVIGGGDWSKDRLIPDFFRSIENNKILKVRYPLAVRPWQHVLDPLCGYIILAQRLTANGNLFSGGWNFGPERIGNKSVSWVLNKFSKKFKNAEWETVKIKKKYEANLLKLDISKAKSKLGWKPKWSLENAIDYTIKWHEALKKKKNMYRFSIEQIKKHQSS